MFSAKLNGQAAVLRVLIHALQACPYPQVSALRIGHVSILLQYQAQVASKVQGHARP
ncbi:hypothetical protein D3C72_2540690 [compost metagenome]